MKCFPTHSLRLLTDARSQLSHAIPDDDPLPVFSQSLLSARLDKYEADLLFQQADNLNRARILAVRMPHAADFLFAPPIASLGLKLSSQEWSVAVAYRLGLRIHASLFKCTSKGCNKLMDIQGLHSMRCGTEGDRLKRHNNLKKFFFQQCVNAQMSPLFEPNHVLRNCGLKPADWGIPDYRPGKFMAYDIAVTDPTQDAFCQRAAIEPGYAAATYARVNKIAKYSDALAKDDSVLFSPIAESYGGWNKDASDFFVTLASWLALRDTSLSSSLILSRLYQRASVILQRGNARMMLSKNPEVKFLILLHFI